VDLGYFWVLEILNQWKNVLIVENLPYLSKKVYGTDLRHISKLKTDSGKQKEML